MLTRRKALAMSLGAAACATRPEHHRPGGRSPWLATVAPCEHNGSGRPGLYPQHNAFSVGSAPDRFFAGQGCYNLITLDEQHVVTVTAVIAESGANAYPEVICLDSNDLTPIWRRPAGGDQAGDRWNYPGAVAALADGFIYAVVGSRLLKLELFSGAEVGALDLPCPQARRDVAYNGYVALSDGRLLMKSIHRAPGCDIDGFTAFLQCGPARRAPSIFVIVDPTRMQIDATWSATDHVGGRVSVAASASGDTAYFVTPNRVHAVGVSERGFVPRPDWEPLPYRRDGEKPATAVVPFGDYVVLQTNASPAAAPTRVIVVSTLDPALTWSCAPFEGSADRSFIPSKPSVDLENNRIYAVDGYGGVAALDFDPQHGLQVAWRDADRSLSFTAVTGPASRRVLIQTAMQDVVGADAHGWPQYRAEVIVWRDAFSGTVLGRSEPLPIGPGLNM